MTFPGLARCKCMRLELFTTATLLSIGALGAAEASAAPTVARGLHNLTAKAYIYERPAAGFVGGLSVTDLFDVTRISRTGRWAQGYAHGDRSRIVWVETSVLSRKPPQAPRELTEVAGPAGSRVFRPAAALECRDTNVPTVGVRLRGARRARVSVLRGGKVVERSRTLVGPGLAVDQVRIPCDGKAILRYTVDGRSKDFAVTVDRGRTT